MGAFTETETQVAQQQGRAPSRALLPLALALWLLLLGFASTNLKIQTRAAQLAYYFAAFAVFCVAVNVVWRLGHGVSRRVVWFILIVGICLRLTLAPMRPITTSDIYRYLWEGRLINQGHNPFAERPNSPHLASLHDWVWHRVDFKSVPAAYPPTAQYVFALADRIPADRLLTLKLMLAAFDIGTLLLLPGLLIRFRRPPAWVLLYAWHPLIVGEVVARGHLDSIGIFFLVLSLRLLVRASARSTFLSGAALAASILAKGYALFVLPFFLLAARPRRGWFTLGLALATIALYLPFASAGEELWRGLRLYSTFWHGYASSYQVIEFAARPFAHDPAHTARLTCGLLLMAWLAYLLVRTHAASLSGRYSQLSTISSQSFLSLAGFFLLSPVLYPWYLAWTVPFLCFRPRPAWLLFTGTVFVFYAHGFAPPHVEIWWLKLLEYAPPLLLALALWRRKPPAGRRSTPQAVAVHSTARETR